MHWQDIALTVASLVFIVALLPTVLSRTSKPVLSTSVLNAAVSFGIAVVYATLHLWFAALTTGVNGTLWLTIALQTMFLRRAAAGGLSRKL